MGDTDEATTTPHDPRALQARLEALGESSALGPDLTFKPMFGGIMAYARGRPFASLSDVGLALKLGAAERETLLREPGAEPLRYAPDAPPSKQYVRVPPAMLDDLDALGAWMERSAAFVIAQPAKPVRPKKPRKPANGLP